MATKHVASGRSVETSGKTVEQAVEAALARLGRTRDEAEVQVLREASRGVLGFGAHDAIVRVTELVPVPAEPEVEEQPAAPALVEAEEAPAGAGVATDVVEEEQEEDDDFLFDEDEEDEEYGPRRVAGAVTDDELLDISREVLLAILERMNVIADVQASWAEVEEEGEEPALILDIIGDDLGLLIGRRGETLRDLQYILRLIVGRKIEGWPNIVVDVEGYKQRREGTIRQLARRMADRALATGRPVHMEPMNPYERRIVHLELRDVEGVKTKSSGEGERRKVGIFPS